MDCKCLLSGQATLSAIFLIKILSHTPNPLNVPPKEHIISASMSLHMLVPSAWHAFPSLPHLVKPHLPSKIQLCDAFL